MSFYCPRGHGPDGPFRAPFNGEASWRYDRTCSYCGSLHPDDFIAAIKGGAEVIPTDKSYKAYVRIAGDGQCKFYFQHLSDGLKQAFIHLLNTRQIRFAVPGRFYVLPFFLSRGAEASG